MWQRKPSPQQHVQSSRVAKLYEKLLSSFVSVVRVLLLQCFDVLMALGAVACVAHRVARDRVIPAGTRYFGTI